jgi:hypothetical protein
MGIASSFCNRFLNEKEIRLYGLDARNQRLIGRDDRG